MKISLALATTTVFAASLALLVYVRAQPQRDKDAPTKFRVAQTTREVSIYREPAKSEPWQYLEPKTPVLVTESVSADGVRWAKVAGEFRDWYVNETALTFSGDVLEARPQKLVAGRNPLGTGPVDFEKKFVVAARKYLGVPYVWGGTSPKGIDTSGLVIRAAREAGFTRFPRVSRDQYRIGVPVAVKDLRAGDRLYFSASRVRVDHTAIYTGNGRIIEANGGFHKVIERELFSTEMFKKMYVGARRGFLPQSTSLVTQPTTKDDPEAIGYSPFVSQFFVQPLYRATEEE